MSEEDSKESVDIRPRMKLKMREYEKSLKFSNHAYGAFEIKMSRFNYNEDVESSHVEKLISDLMGELYELLGSCPNYYYRLSEAGIHQRIQERGMLQHAMSLTDVYKSTVNEIRRTGAGIKAFIS